MATLFALLGLGLYFWGQRDPQLPLDALLITLAEVGLLSLLLALLLGARWPRTTSWAFCCYALLPLVLGSSVAMVALYGAARLLAAKGEHPKPELEVLCGTATTVLGLLVDKFNGIGWLKVATVARRCIRWRYGGRFAMLPGDGSRAYAKAYEALNLDPIADAEGELTGWGLAARRRRLRLIRAAL